MPQSGDEDASDNAREQNYLLVIGIDQYKEFPTLNNAVKDARDIAEVLTSKYRFDQKNTGKDLPFWWATKNW